MSERVLEIGVYQKPATKSLQVSISVVDSDGSSIGYRLAGPKFDGTSVRLAFSRLTRQDADQIRWHLDKVFPPATAGATERGGKGDE